MSRRNPSPVQQEAIGHDRGPARVLAGPGSGKTFTIVQRLLYLIEEKHVDPDQIVTLTFTKAAAREMEQRFLKEIPTHENRVHFGTFHSICYHILQQSASFGSRQLVSRLQQQKLLSVLLANKGITQEASYEETEELLGLISRHKNGMPFGESSFCSPEQAKELVQEYERMMEEQKLLDFDDMIGKCLLLLQKNPAQRAFWQNRFSYFLVDEFQDINEIQYQVVKLLAAPSFNLFVVGDDDQSIYGFRGAAPSIMQQFASDFPMMHELQLFENYRSGAQIVTFASQVISRNTLRIPKTPDPKQKGGKAVLRFLETRKEEEAELLKELNRIGRLSAGALTDTAIILRTNREVFLYQRLLRQAGLPVREKISGQNHLFTHFIREDMQAFLQFCFEGRKRRDFLQIMNKPNRFLTRQALIAEEVREETLLAYYQYNREMCQTVHTLWQHCQRASQMPCHLALRYFRKVMGYDRYLAEQCAVSRNGAQEKETLLHTAELLQELFRKKREKESCEAFLTRMEKEKDSSMPKTGYQEGISVITMHAAKGLEFTYVFLPDVNEGVIPGRNCRTKESLEEERRLLYVAITRAKESVYLFYTRERNRKISRFLAGITLPDQ